MAFSLIVDDSSLLLILVIIVLLAISIFIGKSYQPLVHPLILARQADVSPVRREGQSCIYRNATSPSGYEMAIQPRRAIRTVYDAVSLGTGANDCNVKHQRTLYTNKSCSNQQIVRNSKAFGLGVAKLSGVKQTNSLAVAVCVEADSVESITVTLSGDAQSSIKEADRYAPLIIPAAHLAAGNVPSALPQSGTSASHLHAVFTTSVAVHRVSELPIVDEKTIFVFATKQQAEDAQSILKRKTFAFEDVLAQASSFSSNDNIDEKKPQGDAHQLGQTIHSAYWTGKRSGWICVSNASLIAGLTAQLGFFPADQQPTMDDCIFVEQQPSFENPAQRLTAASTPAGLTIVLLALYTNANLLADVLTTTYDGPSPPMSQSFAQAQPTIVFTSPAGASSFAASLCATLRRSPLSKFAVHTKLAALRHGTFGKQDWWDGMVFNNVRQTAGCQRVRSFFIVGEGPSVGQGLLDILRTLLGCAVRLAYLPVSPLRIFDDSLEAGVNADSTSDGSPQSTYALSTVPLTVTHSLDLQAFATHPSRKNGTQQHIPAHVGPPNVTVAIKLVESQLAKQAGMSTSGGAKSDHLARQAGDPMGEIFVSGTCLGGPSSAQQWCATNDVGIFRSNGTLVVLSDKNDTVQVGVPTLSSEKVTSHRASMIGSGGAPTRMLPAMANALMIILFTLTVLTDATQALQVSNGRVFSSSHSVKRASDSSVNATFVNAALQSFMNSQRSSWEQGVAQSAILEYYGGQWSVFSGDSAPGYIAGKSGSELPAALLSMANAAVIAQNEQGELCARVTGDERLKEGSALDPASCGEAVLLAAYANGEITSNGQLMSGRFADAAQRQLDYLLNNAPRNPSGAISMRNTGEAYWSDGVYMAPPFIALYGLMTNNETLLQTAYDQIRLYREALRIPSGDAQGLFMHIVNATNASAGGQDLNPWLTGNAWSAAGMCRVLASIAQSSYAESSMSTQLSDLINWTNELVTYALNFADMQPLLYNYINDTSTFQDAGGSALIAYATYRLASIVGDQPLVEQLSRADAIYNAVQDRVGPYGQLVSGTSVVNQLTFTSAAQSSPERMSFFVLLAAARRDHANGNVTGVRGPNSSGSNDAAHTLAKQANSVRILAIVGLASALGAALL